MGTQYDPGELATALADIKDLAAMQTLQERSLGGAGITFPSEWDVDEEELAEIRADFEWIDAAFTDRLPPDPGVYLSELAGFQDVAKVLYGEGLPSGPTGVDDPAGELTLDHVSTMVGTLALVPDLMKHWNGNAALAFQTSIVDNLQPVIGTTANLAGTIWTVYNGLYQLYTSSRNRLMSIATQTRTALEALPAEPDNSGMFARISAIATIAAGIATLPIPGLNLAGQAAVVGSFTMIAGASAAEALEQPEAEPPLAGDCVAEVIDNMSQALRDYDGRLERKEDKVAEALRDNLAAIDERPADTDLQPIRLVLPRPRPLVSPDRGQDLTGDTHFVPDTMWGA